MRKISDHIENNAPENENQKVITEILPIFTQIFEYESSKECSNLADQPQIQIYEFIVGLVQTSCPQITIQKPQSLQEQQIQQF